MTLQTWLAFALAAAIVLVIPGPTILSVISHSLAYGRRAVAPLYALFAGHLREKAQRPATRRWFNRCGGTALIGAGLLTATLRRPS
jgi:threonine/homoserine/homoserine lactone efflux protein